MALTGHFVWRGSLLNTQPGTDFSKRAVSALVGSSKHHLCVWTDQLICLTPCGLLFNTVTMHMGGTGDVLNGTVQYLSGQRDEADG